MRTVFKEKNYLANSCLLTCREEVETTFSPPSSCMLVDCITEEEEDDCCTEEVLLVNPLSSIPPSIKGSDFNIEVEEEDVDS